MNKLKELRKAILEWNLYAVGDEDCISEQVTRTNEIATLVDSIWYDLRGSESDLEFAALQFIKILSELFLPETEHSEHTYKQIRNYKTMVMRLSGGLDAICDRMEVTPSSP